MSKTPASKPRTNRSTPKATPEQIVFQKALALAAQSAVARLELAPLDLGHHNDQFLEHMGDVARQLGKELRASGATGSFTVDDLDLRSEEADARVVSLARHCGDAGYLYGLAVGVTLARGGGSR
jgi:hypothetical protein